MAQIKLKKLVEKLTKLYENHGDIEVIIDYDADVGWYNLEKVQVVKNHDHTANDYAGRTDIFINLQSSNEI